MFGGVLLYVFVNINFQLFNGHYTSDLKYAADRGIFIPVGFNNYPVLNSLNQRRDDVPGKRSNELPENIDDIKESQEYLAGVNCILSTKSEDNRLFLEISECEEQLPLSYFIKKFYNGVDISKILLGFIQSEKLIFKSLTINENTVDFTAESNGELYSHTQTMLNLENVELLKLQLPKASNSEFSLKNLAFQLEGILNGLKVSCSSFTGKDFVTIDVEGAESVDSILSIWYLNLENLVTNKVGFSLNKFNDVSVVEPKITGVYNANGDFQLLLKFSADNEDIFKNGATAYFVINKPADSPVGGAFFMEYKESVPIIHQMKEFIDYKYSQADYAANIIKPWVLTASDNIFNIIKVPEFLELFNDVIPTTIDAGINVYFQADIKKSLSMSDPSSQDNQNTPASGILMKMSFFKSLIRTTFPSTFSADLRAMMKSVFKDTAIILPKLLFPEGFRLPLDIKEIDINPDKNSYKLSVAYPKSIKIFGPLSISNIELNVSKEAKDKPWQFTGSAEVKFGPDINGNVEINFDSQNSFKITIKVPFIDVASIASAFGANLFAGNEFIKSFLNVGVKDLEIEVSATLSKKGSTEITISGTPIINSLPTVTLAGYIWTPDDPAAATTTGIAVGFVIKKDRLDAVLKKLTGMDMTAAWLKDASLVLLVSNAHKNYCTNHKNKDRPECKKESEKDEKNEESKDEDGDKKSTTPVRKQLEKRFLKLHAKKVNHHAKSYHHAKSLKHSHHRRAIDSAEDQSDSKSDSETMTKEKTHFSAIQELSDIEIKKGLYVRATLELTNDCSKDPVCEFLTEKLGYGAKIVLEGEFTTGSAKITASLEVTIPLSENVDLKKVSLIVEIGRENKIEIRCEFHVKDPKLVIAGFIGIDLSGKLSIGGSVTGMIERVFNIEWLAIGNLYLKIGLDLKTALPTLEFGAAIYIGYAATDGKAENRFKFEGYLGIDPSDPSNNYFHARSFGKDLTIENVLKLLGINMALPKIVRESGFYGELLFSLNLGLKDKEIKEFGITIPSGFAFKGALNFLSYKIKCEIKFNPKAGSFYLDADFDPIDDWGQGLIKVYRSEENRALGPKLKINLDLNAKVFEVYIEGLIGILGMERYLKIEITAEKFIFVITGNIWGVLRAQLNVEAQYGGGALSLFAFKGCLQFDLQQISEAIKKALVGAKEKAAAALSSARDAVTASKASVTKAFDKVRGWKQDIENYKARLRARSEELERQKAALGQSCVEECGDVCVPFFGWISDCYQIWGVTYGCLSWDNCKWRVSNILCIAGCEIRKGFSQFVAWAEQLGIKILLGLSDIGNALLDATSFIEQIAQGVLDAANGVLYFAEQATQAILDLPVRIIDAVSSFITIHEFCVFGKIDPKEHACLGIKFDVTLLAMRKKYEGSVCLNLKIYDSLGSTAAKQRVPEIEDLDSKAARINANVGELNEKKNKVDAESSRVGNEVSTKTTSSIEKRTTVLTEEQLYYHKLAHDPLPHVHIRSQETMNLLRNADPWKDHNFEELVVKRQDATKPMNFATTMKHEKIPNEESPSACRQQQNVISRYQTMADGFYTTLKFVNNARDSYLSQKKSYLNHIRSMDDIIRKNSFQNMTLEERQDILYWRDDAEKYINGYIEKSELIFKDRKRKSINNLRRQFNEKVEKERGIKLPQYIKHLHSLAVDASRRSTISQNTINADSLNNLHKMLLVLATDDRTLSQDYAKTIDSVNRLLSTVKRSNVPCAA